MRTAEAALKTRVDAGEILALGSQSPIFVKKVFRARQSFSRNIKSWEGPVKTYLPLGVAPLTDW